MRSNALAFPFVVLAASALGWHGCQPTTAGGAKPTAAAPTPAGSTAVGLTLLYQNNGNGEIEPCG
ncbi:MAG TPA: hypothetical protein VMV18_03615 [bacterium]|nr:hypothetical protein [bacterium]